MRHGSLCSGIGAAELAAQWMGWENVFHCEKDPFCQRVLKHYWPNSDSHSDLTETEFTKYANEIDVVSAGFPCQPYSTAGLRLGKLDPRHLWPHVRRAYNEIGAPWVLGENVRGITNWQGGLVFEEICSDLESDGYSVCPFLLPACGINAPHQRYRVFFIAYSYSNDAIRSGFGKDRSEEAKGEVAKKEREWLRIFSERIGEAGFVANTAGERWFQNNPEHEPKKLTQNIPNWENFPTQSPVCIGDDGLSSRLDGITISRHRRESIKAGGNAIVPGLVYQVFQTIEKYNKITK